VPLHPTLYSRPMSDLPIDLEPALLEGFVTAFDRQGKIVRAIEALGPVADRDVVIVDSTAGPIVAGLTALGSRLSHAGLTTPALAGVADASADVVLGLWSSFRGPDQADLREADRVLRTEGRHLVVLDYGRDDVSRLRGERPEYGAWSRRGGTYLEAGFKLRVLHCFWEWTTIDEVGGFLDAAFGELGRAVTTTLKRPRLSYNVAVYHRSRP
jgi:hypothetical protein